MGIVKRFQNWLGRKGIIERRVEDRRKHGLSRTNSHGPINAEERRRQHVGAADVAFAISLEGKLVSPNRRKTKHLNRK